MPLVSEVAFRDAERMVMAVYGLHAKSRRTVKVEVRDTYTVRDYWDEGTRYHVRFVSLSSGAPTSFVPLSRSNLGGLAGENQKAGNPYNLDLYEVTLDPSFAIVENAYYGGKDRGFRIILHPSYADKWKEMVR